MLSLEARVLKLAEECISHCPAGASLTSSLVDDLGADSLDIIELIMAVEEEFNIDIDDESISKFQYVKDIVDHLTKLGF